MRHYPLFLDLTGRTVLVVGGGARAAAKVRLLASSGAQVRVVAPALGDELSAIGKDGAIDWRCKGFDAADLQGVRLVISATGLDAVDRAVAAAADGAGLAVNVVDRPDLCTFLTPAIVDRDSVVVAISTGGLAPVLARRLKSAIDRLLPSRLGRLADMASGFRGALAHRLHLGDQRRRFWQSFFDGAIAERVLAGDEAGARAEMLRTVNSIALDGQVAQHGSLHWIELGSDDPDLLTLKAHRLLGEADVIVHDGDGPTQILDYARRDAERRVLDGAAIGGLADLMRAGLKVVRLTKVPFVDAEGALTRAGLTADAVPAVRRDVTGPGESRRQAV
ncbi:MAG: NAD(P)-dependent oxidoreductase [Rhodospirillales bacterium]